MMRSYVPILLLLLFLPNAALSEDGLPAPKLSVGQVIKLHTVRIKKRVQRGKIARDQTISWTQTITLKDEHPDGFEATSRTTNLVVKAGSPQVQAMVEGMLRPFENKDLRAVISPAGVPLRVDGWKGMVAGMFDQLEASMAPLLKDMKPESAKQVTTIVKSMIAKMQNMDDTQAVGEVLTSMALWANWHATDLQPGGSQSLSMNLPNPLGGAKLKLEGAAKRQPVKDGVVVVEVQQSLDRDQLQAMLTSMLNTLGMKDNEKIKAAVQNIMQQNAGMENKQRFELDAGTGITRRLTSSTETRIGNIIVDTDQRTITATVQPAPH